MTASSEQYHAWHINEDNTIVCRDCGARLGPHYVCPSKSVEDEVEDLRILGVAAAPSRTEQFDAALGFAANVTADRGAVYGHPYDDFGRAATLKSAVSDCDDERVRHVLEMICVKMARLIHTPSHLDSWIDIAGYARTAVMVLDRQEQETKP